MKNISVPEFNLTNLILMQSYNLKIINNQIFVLFYYFTVVITKHYDKDNL